MTTYATLSELKVFLRTPDDATDDTHLTLCLGAATEAIDMACGTTYEQFNPVPSTIKLATLMQAGRWAKRRDAPFGIAGSPETGSEMRLLAKLDPDVEVMLGGYGERPRAGGTT